MKPQSILLAAAIFLGSFAAVVVADHYTSQPARASTATLPKTEVVRRVEYVPNPDCLRFVKKADRLVSLSLLADDVQLKSLNAVEESDLSRLVNLTEKLSAYTTLQSETADAYLATRDICTGEKDGSSP